ncbi:HAD family hydrolase [Amycolatopsis sp. K13G38]|uniref:HAD family hydrolase n=1 Tax=Amycolatopsis acididurans TaxID=2724524 RepID=A0ABX1IXR8_9PSEU|nr:HAD hydrolase-like protein [Amycolatopsis acididurans]NKQ52249.1 HAD family hydrolase [Amycolatopsis acididurans]
MSDRKPPARAVIFDLDGTLVQTRVASWEIFSRINDRFGLGVDSPDKYFDLFRGNVFASIRELCQDERQASEVSDAFLASLREDYTPALVPGVADVVRTLAGHCTLAVMSSNAMQVLRRVLVDNGLAYCFAHVFGGDVTPDKRTAIAAFLADSGNGFGRRCAADYDETGHTRTPDRESTVLVTDTAGDVRDALDAGIRVVGVAWGMHGVDELTAAGAEFVALWPQELPAYLLGDAAAAGPVGTCAVAPALGPAGSCGGAPAAPGSCGCGCDGTSTKPAVAPRRERRRAAVRAQSAGRHHHRDPSAELVEAIRRVCG